MTTGTGSRGCVEFIDELPLLALGTSSGRERAEVIAHLESCAECAGELEGLSIAADTLLLLAPEATPPNGFETRTVAAMTAGRDSRRFSARVLGVAAAVTLAAGVGLGALLGVGGSSNDATFASATLTSSSGATGDVFLSWGSEAWMFVTLSGAPAHGPVACTITLANGKKVTAGHFYLDGKYGSWAVWLKVPASAIRRVSVVDKSGVVLASAKVEV